MFTHRIAGFIAALTIPLATFTSPLTVSADLALCPLLDTFPAVSGRTGQSFAELTAERTHPFVGGWTANVRGETIRFTDFPTNRVHYVRDRLAPEFGPTAYYDYILAGGRDWIKWDAGNGFQYTARLTADPNVLDLHLDAPNGSADMQAVACALPGA